MPQSVHMVFLVYAGVLGASVGSFLNVCVGRLPRGESPVRPRSKCPRCGGPIAWYDNIPLLSWALLRGRCRLGGRLGRRRPCGPAVERDGRCVQWRRGC